MLSFALGHGCLGSLFRWVSKFRESEWAFSEWGASAKKLRRELQLSRCMSAITLVANHRYRSCITTTCLIWQKTPIFSVSRIKSKHRMPLALLFKFSSFHRSALLTPASVVICPGGPSTFRIVNAPVLDALGPNGFLINVARGSVVDEAALLERLQNRKLGGAALDVFEQEPKM
jgi:hypothetical protein